MKKFVLFLKIKLSALVLFIVILFNTFILALLTVHNYSYSNELPQSGYLSNDFGNNIEFNTYYLNQAGDINRTDSQRIDDLINNESLSKLGIIPSYVKLITLTKNNFILSGKHFNSNGTVSTFSIYDINGSMCIIYFKNLSDDTEFAVYKTDNKELSKELLKYKQDGEFYVYYPEWKNDLIDFNLRGKIFIFSFALECVMFYFIISKTGNHSKPLKK